MTTPELPADASGHTTVRYVGFWARALASLIDSILLIALMTPLSFLVFGSFQYDDARRNPDLTHFLINTLIPAMAVIVFWVRVQATPGKMLVHARIVDAATGADPRPGQSVIRYLGYFVSTIVFGLGFLWIAFDPRKQGWHDKFAGTVVVYHREPRNAVA